MLLPLPAEKNSCGRFPLCLRDLPRPRQNPLSFVSLLYHKAMLGLRGS